MAELMTGTDIRETVRERYAAAARAAEGEGCGCGTSAGSACCGTETTQVFGDASIDVVISNCVINLSGDKDAVLREAARVLRPGGRLAVSDVIADPDMDDVTRADMRQWTGCVAGALTRDEFEQSLRDAGLEEIDIRETHRVHQHAASGASAVSLDSYSAAPKTSVPVRSAVLTAPQKPPPSPQPEAALAAWA